MLLIEIKFIKWWYYYASIFFFISSSGAARHLATKLGASVAIVGRNEKKLNDVAEQIKSDGGPEPLAIVADVTKDSEKIINETINRFGKLDVLVNNAGMYQMQNLETITLEAFDKVFDTNVRSVIRLTQLAVPHLEKTKGNIINVSSIGGICAYPDELGYGLSKSALDQFTRCISVELGPKGIRVNSINPADIDTPILQTVGQTDEDIQKYKEKVKTIYPVGRIGNTGDTANAIEFLAKAESSFINGILLLVDGGLKNVTPPRDYLN